MATTVDPFITEMPLSETTIVPTTMETQIIPVNISETLPVKPKRARRIALPVARKTKVCCHVCEHSMHVVCMYTESVAGRSREQAAGQPDNQHEGQQDQAAR